MLCGVLSIRPIAALAIAIAIAIVPVGEACAQNANPIKVVATIKPVHSLLAGVMEGVATPTLLLDGPASPHTYTLKPSDVRRLSDADLVIMVSGRLETFMARIGRSLPTSVALIALDQAPGLIHLEVREGGAFEADGDHHGHAAHAASTAAPAPPAAQADGHDGHDGHEHDPHIWLDPLNAKAMVAQLAVVLSGAAPRHSAVFQANAAKVMARLDALSAGIGRDLSGVRQRPFIVFHDAYQYFEARFGMPAAGAITINPEIPPGAKRLAQLRAKITSARAVCVFSEPQFDSKLVQTLVDGTAAKIGSLDANGAAVTPGPDAYFMMIQDLAVSLKTCLAADS